VVWTAIANCKFHRKRSDSETDRQTDRQADRQTEN
jgi:hypothetical protein